MLQARRDAETLVAQHLPVVQAPQQRFLPRAVRAPRPQSDRYVGRQRSDGVRPRLRAFMLAAHWRDDALRAGLAIEG